MNKKNTAIRFDETAEMTDAVHIVTRFLGLKKTQQLDFEELLSTSKIRTRKVVLNKEWWKYDGGPLIGYSHKFKQYCALIPKANTYYLVIPALKINMPVNLKIAESLDRTALSLYRSFPDKILDFKDLFLFSTYRLMNEISTFLVIEGLVSALALLFPIMLGLILDYVIPNADIDRLTQFLFALFISILASTAFSLSQSFILMRIQFKTNVATQAAVWDRLLRIPLNFFRKYTAGDLASRARGVDSIQQQLTQTLYSIILNGFMSVLLLGLLFYYNLALAFISLALALIGGAIIFLFEYFQLKYERTLLELKGKLSGLLFQLLTSISKLRVSNGEERGFHEWTKIFLEKNKVFLKSHTLANHFAVLFPIFTVVATIVLYGFVIKQMDHLTFGEFIAFNAAFGLFFASILAITTSITEIILIIPLYERIKPILTTLPENTIEDKDLKLKGKIEIKNIKFRYDEESPLLFDDLSITLKPNQRIAIVGQTGSGKSTLFRLLLGFETPEAGSIYYDGVDLKSLNIQKLRSKLGVILQTSTLLPGTIYENIAGFEQKFSVEQAFEAARLAAVDEEIEMMPMGMHTLVLEGGRTFSVGQRSRIMLARALIQKPKILFLDEATSALDNKTQEIIYKNLEKLKITQLIAAHRLSTIRNADCIYVIENGKIIQKGNYEELTNMEGLFQQMVLRQTL